MLAVKHHSYNVIDIMHSYKIKPPFSTRIFIKEKYKHMQIIYLLVITFFFNAIFSVTKMNTNNFFSFRQQEICLLTHFSLNVKELFFNNIIIQIQWLIGNVSKPFLTEASVNALCLEAGYSRNTDLSFFSEFFLSASLS